MYIYSSNLSNILFLFLNDDFRLHWYCKKTNYLTLSLLVTSIPLNKKSPMLLRDQLILRLHTVFFRYFKSSNFKGSYKSVIQQAARLLYYPNSYHNKFHGQNLIIHRENHKNILAKKMMQFYLQFLCKKIQFFSLTKSMKISKFSNKK